MPVFEYQTNRGTFQFESNREMNDAELEQAIKEHEIKNMSVGDIVSKNFIQAAKDVHSEVLSPIGSGFNEFLFGAPRAMLKAFNPELDRAIFPEQQTMEGKTIRLMATARGLLTGLATKTGAKIAEKVIPKAAEKTLGKRAIKSAVHGGVAGGTQIIGEPEDAVLDQVGRQAWQSAISSGVGGASPVIGKAVSVGYGKGKQVVGQTIENIKNIRKGYEGYISDVVAPKLTNTVTGLINKLDPKVVSYVERQMKIPRESLQVISKKGDAALNAVYEQTRGLTTDVANRLKTGLGQRREIADQAYNMAMQSVPDGHSFSINNTRSTIKTNLMKKGLLDRNGIPTERVKIATTADKALIDVYDELNRLPDANKTDFTFLRDKLSSLYKETGTTNADVYKAVSALYDDAADSGFKGLQEARALQKRAFAFEDEFSRRASLLDERKLNAYNRWTAEERSTLKKLVSYIEDEFPLDAGILDDLQNINASRDLQVLNQKISPDVIRKDLLSASNPENFNTVKGKWAEIIGKDSADKIFGDVKRSVAAKQFKETAIKVAIPAASISAGMLLGGASMRGFGAYKLGTEGIRTVVGGD